MDGGTEPHKPNRTNQTARRTEPKPKQNPSQKPKRTETNRGFTAIVSVVVRKEFSKTVCMYVHVGIPREVLVRKVPARKVLNRSGPDPVSSQRLYRDSTLNLNSSFGMSKIGCPRLL